MKMKKNNLLILAVAALGFAACSSDETTAVNEKLAESNAISFRANVNGQMRDANAAGVKTTPWVANDKIYVNAIRTVSSTPSMYFQSEFDYTTTEPAGFYSTNKYYWPADIATNNIYFTAFWGVPYKTVSSATQYSAYVAKDEFKLNGAYTVADAVSSQMDILYAQSAAISSKPAGGGVVLNFRHMLSQIVVQVANDQANLAINITGVKVGNAKETGTFQYISGTSDPEPATTGIGKINKGSWTAQTNPQTYTQASTATMSGTVASQTLGTFTPMILMPQQLTAADAYNAVNPSPTAITEDTEPAVNGSYIALQMAITDKNSGVTIVAKQWCVWPIATEWQPGYKYTYTVNAGSGGYHPIDRDNNLDLDPVFDNAFIWFTPECTIDAWTDFDGNDTVDGTQPINVPF